MNKTDRNDITLEQRIEELEARLARRAPSSQQKSKARTTKAKRNLFTKLVVCGIIFLNTLFAIAILFVFLKTDAEPSALVVAWFGFTTGELWALAGIKKCKENNKDGTSDG